MTMKEEGIFIGTEERYLEGGEVRGARDRKRVRVGKDAGGQWRWVSGARKRSCTRSREGSGPHKLEVACASHLFDRAIYRVGLSSSFQERGWPCRFSRRIDPFKVARMVIKSQ